MNKGKKFFTTISAVVATVLVVGGIMACWLYRSGFGIAENVSLYIDHDDNVDSVRHKISVIAEPDNMFSFDVFASLLSLDQKLKTGKYDIDSSESMLQLIRKIRNHNQTPVKLVVRDHVHSMEDMAGRLARNLMVDSAEVAAVLTNDDAIAQLGYTRESIFALFVPNTYEVYWDMSVDALMARLTKEHDAFWTEERKALLAEVSAYAGREMNAVDVATMASIVDSETANDGEKANIASLYLNRLRIGMPLQSDPTVKFALQEFGLRRILNKHLAVESPYNTYRNTGLPPGPICVPTISGIDAVLHHAHNDYLYMCAKEDFSGTHNFAHSYSEHLENARRYTRALDARGIK